MFVLNLQMIEVILSLTEQDVTKHIAENSFALGHETDSTFIVHVLFSCMDCPSACNQKTSIQCRGNSTRACWDMSGPGGGGSGGSIYLSAKLVNVGE